MICGKWEGCANMWSANCHVSIAHSRAKILCPCKISKYLAGGLDGGGLEREGWRLSLAGMLMKLKHVIDERRAVVNTVDCNRWKKKKMLIILW